MEKECLGVEWAILLVLLLLPQALKGDKRELTQTQCVCFCPRSLLLCLFCVFGLRAPFLTIAVDYENTLGPCGDTKHWPEKLKTMDRRRDHMHNRNCTQAHLGGTYKHIGATRE